MISAIGSDVATWHPPPPSYEMQGQHRSRGSLGRQVVSSRRDAPEEALDFGTRADPVILVKGHSRTLGHASVRCCPPCSTPRTIRRLSAQGYSTRWAAAAAAVS